MNHPRKPPEGFIEKLLDVLALVLAEPRTVRQMLEITEYKADTLHKYMDRAIDYGLVYICRYDPHPLPGREPRAVYAMQPSPFKYQSVPRPS